MGRGHAGGMGEIQTGAFPLPEGQPHASLGQPARSATRSGAGGRPRIENDKKEPEPVWSECRPAVLPRSTQARYPFSVCSNPGRRCACPGLLCGRPSACLSDRPSACLSHRPSACLSDRPSARLSHRPSACLSDRPPRPDSRCCMQLNHGLRLFATLNGSTPVFRRVSTSNVQRPTSNPENSVTIS